MNDISGRTYTVVRVALMLHVSPKLIIEAIEQGKLKAVKNNGTYLVPDESMREFMKNGNPFVAWEQYTIIRRDSGVELVSEARFASLDEALAKADVINREAGSPIAVVWKIEYTDAQPIKEEIYEVVDETSCKTVKKWTSVPDAIVFCDGANEALKRLGDESRFIVQTSNSRWMPVEAAKKPEMAQ